MKFSSSILGLLLAVVAPVSCFAAEAPQRGVTIRGNLLSLKGDELIVGAVNGPVSVKVAERTGIRSEITLGLSDIKPGMYLGTTAQKQSDGTFRSSEVHVFAEAQRGVGEGHRPSSSTPNSTMTNANVDKVEEATVQDVNGRMVTLKYTGGEVRVFVPPETPIVLREPGTRALLKPGAAVVVRGNQPAEGPISAAQITVVVNGRPPM
jgi:hypothetical protein